MVLVSRGVGITMAGPLTVQQEETPSGRRCLQAEPRGPASEG